MTFDTDKPESVVHSNSYGDWSDSVSFTIDERIEMNRKFVECLQHELTTKPDLDMQFRMRRIWGGILVDQRRGPRWNRKQNQKQKQLDPPSATDLTKEYLEAVISTLSTAKTSVVHPLSKDVETLLCESGWQKPKIETLGAALSKILAQSDSLFIIRGYLYVWKINEAIAVKVSTNHDTTEYSSLLYLAEHAPHIPAPRPFGYLTAGSLRVTFFTYFPSTTLQKVWPSLTHDNKIAIQAKLDGILCDLREIRCAPGTPLGGIGREGVKDDHGWVDHQTHRPLKTVQEFINWQYEVKMTSQEPMSNLLKSLLPEGVEEHPIVFTHGDFWTANIMVDLNSAGQYFVTGIIDWETSGFYPAFFEQTKILHNFDVGREDDWYKYVPSCIAPSKDPHMWLLTRVWDRCWNI